MSSLRSGFAGSAIQAFADQALYSLSNVVLTLALAHRLSLNDYGIFAVIMTTSFVGIASLRAISTERVALQLRLSGTPASPAAIVRQSRSLVAVLLACATVAVLIAIAFRPSALVLAVMLVPVLTLADLAHSALVLSSAYRVALEANVLWLGVSAASVLLSDSASTILGGWAAGALIAVTWAVMRMRNDAGRGRAGSPPALPPGLPTIRSWPILLDHLGPRVLNQLAFFGLAWSGGFAEAGVFRLAQAFVSPLDLMMIASLPLGVASLAGIRPDSSSEQEVLRRLEVTLAAGSVALLVVGLAAIVVNPWSILRPPSVPVATIVPVFLVVGIRSLAGVAAIAPRIRVRQADGALHLARNELIGSSVALVLLAAVVLVVGEVDATLLAAVLTIGTLLGVHLQRELVRTGVPPGLTAHV